MRRGSFIVVESIFNEISVTFPNLVVLLSISDPHTKLHYANIAEFKIIKKLPSDLVGGYLTLRRANTQLQ